jgi:hypothetical protein
MFVVPLPKDVITTKDGAELEVITYTNFKTKGPAVYVEHQPGTPAVVIYFFDIEKINGVRVDLNGSSKVFNALGKIKRRFHLPQPNDQITVSKSSEESPDGTDIVEVQTLKLHSRNLGLSKGLLIQDKDKTYHRLNDILDLKRAVGGDTFNKKAFLRLYSEYRGYVGK